MAERFSGLRYNPKKATKKPDEEWPALFARHAEFRKLREWQNYDKIFAYIMYMYTKESDLTQEIPTNLRERKEAAAIEAGYKINDDGTWPSEIEKIMTIKNQSVFDAIMCWLKIQNHDVWTDLVVTEQELWDYQRLRFRSIETGEKKKVKKKPGEEGEQEPVTKKEKEVDIYSAANKRDPLMEMCSSRIAKCELLRKKLYGDSIDDFRAPEFDEMITPENAERLMYASR